MKRALGMALLALVLPGCRGDGEEVLVSAAASLTGAFADIEAAFEDRNPDVDVVLNLGASSSLREQILAGAPADVYASANRSNMEIVEKAGAVAGEAAVFARNRLQIAVPEENPGGVEGLEDLGREDLLVGLCAEGVPCGDLAREALAAAGVEPAIDTNEPDVRALLTKVAARELDAAIVYTTDVAGAVGVEGVDIPAGHNPMAEYPIALLTAAPNPEAGLRFVQFVLSDAGQEILERHGFGPP